MSLRHIRSLGALKMEKNFTAVIDKDYNRMPHIEYPPLSNHDLNLFMFTVREQAELEEAMQKLGNKWHFWNSNDEWWGPSKDQLREMSVDDRTRFMVDLKHAMLEVADVSNTMDYLFEGLLRLYCEARP